MPEHTHKLDMFSKGASSAIQLARRCQNTHSLDTFSEETISAIQLVRTCQNTLTIWTHFQKEPHQPSSLAEDARTHSHPGHIFRRGLISHPAGQKMPEHTHILDTFSEGASSDIQLGQRWQNTLTPWAHFQKGPHQTSSLPEDARTHSQTGHIFRRSLISHPACRKMPEHTHALDTFSEGASSAIQLARRCQKALTPWTHFRRGLTSHPAWQKMPEHTHSLDTCSEEASSDIQLARRCQNTLTYWTHFQKEPHQPSSLPEDVRTHSHPGQIFRRSLISYPAWQKMPEHTHILDTFSEGASSDIQLGRRCQNTLTSWTDFQ